MDNDDRGLLDELVAGVLFVVPLCHPSCSDVMSCSCVWSFVHQKRRTKNTGTSEAITPFLCTNKCGKVVNRNFEVLPKNKQG